MAKGLINRILPFSSVDGPGNRSTIFLQGCNFNCLYCHNPETIKLCNNCGNCLKACEFGALAMEACVLNESHKAPINSKKHIIYDKSKCRQCDLCLKACENCSSPKALKMSVEEVLKEIEKTRPFISGITVSGGECTLQIEFLTALFKEVKKMGLTTFIDTNGSIDLRPYEEFLEVVDMAMVDLKAYDSEEHIRLTSKDNKNVIENIRFLGSIGKLYEVRTVIVPEILNNEYNVDKTSKLIASIDNKIRYKIIKYRAIGVRGNIISSYTPSDEYMEALKSIAENNGVRDVVMV